MIKKILSYVFIFASLVICLCSFITPTYCSSEPNYISQEYFEITDTFNTSQNYYNKTNIQYVSFKNFNITANSFSDPFTIYSCNFPYGDFNLSSQPSLVLSDDVYLSADGVDYKIGTYTWSYVLWCDPTVFTLQSFRSGFQFTPSNISVPLKLISGSNIQSTLPFYTIKLPYVPVEYLQQNSNFFSVNKTNAVSGLTYNIEFDIEYQNQYFYNDTFSIAVGNRPVGIADENITVTNYMRTISFYDNNNNIFSSSFVSSSTNIPNSQVHTIKNNYNYQSAYYTHFKLEDKVQSISVPRVWVNLPSNYYNYFTIGFFDTTQDFTNFYLISQNSQDMDSMSSPLIPNGSNSYYKDGAWYDIPTHLYNFFIFMLFDCPIISDFLGVIATVIEFFISMLNFVISLFDGIENLFFISIFVGFFVLVIILKLIFKG